MRTHLKTDSGASTLELNDEDGCQPGGVRLVVLSEDGRVQADFTVDLDELEGAVMGLCTRAARARMSGFISRSIIHS